MNVFETIQGLNNTKRFRPDKVDDKLVGVILHMATQTTSAGNVQEWRFVVVKDARQKERLFNAALKQAQIKDAPVSIVVCTDLKVVSSKYGKRGELLYSLQDTAAAVQNMMLTARGLGLGVYWVRAFDEEGVKEILNLPANIRPVAILAVGHAEAVDNADRNEFESHTWVDKWGEKYEISYIVQEPGIHRHPKPIGNAIVDAVKKYRKEKKLDFSKFIKKLYG